MLRTTSQELSVPDLSRPFDYSWNIPIAAAYLSSGRIFLMLAGSSLGGPLALEIQFIPDEVLEKLYRPLGQFIIAWPMIDVTLALMVRDVYHSKRKRKPKRADWTSFWPADVIPGSRVSRK